MSSTLSEMTDVAVSETGEQRAMALQRPPVRRDSWVMVDLEPLPQKDGRI